MISGALPPAAMRANWASVQLGLSHHRSAFLVDHHTADRRLSKGSATVILDLAGYLYFAAVTHTLPLFDQPLCLF